MAKWNVKLETTVEADTRGYAWVIAREIEAHYSDLIQATAVSLEPVDGDYIAVNIECPHLFKTKP